MKFKLGFKVQIVTVHQAEEAEKSEWRGESIGVIGVWGEGKHRSMKI